MTLKDELENDWGTQLVPSYITDRCASKSSIELDKLIRKDVRGFKLHNILSSGTNANQDTILLATNYEPARALYGLCSYVGGNEYTQELSTSMYDSSSALAGPKHPENATRRCLMQCVALPHWVDCQKFTLEEKEAYEDKCLRQLHKLLLVAKLKGTPFKALLVEYILSGNGGELSYRYLRKLGILLKAYDVIVVADEVLTGGRVGPTMAMTTAPGMPKEFVERVEWITMGKFMLCAIILNRIPNKPTGKSERLRGTSTVHEAGRAFCLWQEVSTRMKAGFVERRKEQVLTKLGVDDNTENAWGSGLLLFHQGTRWQMTKGLKNRALPMMDTSVPVRKLGIRKSHWCRSTVTEMLKDRAAEWMQSQV